MLEAQTPQTDDWAGALRVFLLVVITFAWIAAENALGAELQFAVPGLRAAIWTTILATLLYLFWPVKKVSIPVAVSNAFSLTIPCALLWAKRTDYRTDAAVRILFSVGVALEIGFLLIAHKRILVQNPDSDRKLDRYKWAPWLGAAVLLSGVLQLIAAIVHVFDKRQNQTRSIVIGLAIASFIGHLGTSFSFWFKDLFANLSRQVVGSAIGAVAGLAIIGVAYETRDVFLVTAALIHAFFEVVTVLTLHEY